MKADEITLEKQGFNFSAKSMAARTHYKFMMSMGHVFPTTKAQAKHFVTGEFMLDALNKDDVEKVETMLEKHGFRGNYKYTKSKKWVRLTNMNNLWEAIKKEYSL